MAITREQIYSTANTLDSEGIRPTLAAVRRRLGRGSFTTISEALNEWKLIKETNALHEMHAPLPQELIEKFHVVQSTLWSSALELATHRFNQDKVAIEDKSREKEDYYAELERLSEEYEIELEASKACIEQLRHEVTTLNQRLTDEEKTSKALHQSLIDSEASRKMSERRTEELKIELDRTHQQAEQLQRSLATLTTGFEAMQDRLLNKVNNATKHLTPNNLKITDKETKK